MSRRGRFVALEGNDGSGKTTLCGELADAFRSRGERVRVVQRYFRPEITRLFLRLVDDDLIDQVQVFLLSAADHWAGMETAVIEPLEAGETVITDRYVYTHLVHFASRGVDDEVLHSALRGFLVPDAVVVLDAAPEVTWDRVRGPMKPDMWECGLDHRLGVTIGEANRRWRAGEIGEEDLRRHFDAQQRDMTSRFRDVVPSDRTIWLDASGEIDIPHLVRSIDSMRPPMAPTIEPA